MYKQSILDSLSGMFPNITWEGLSQLDPEGISSAFAQEYDIESQDLPSSLFYKLDPSLFQASKYSTYSPMMQSEGSSLLTDLSTSLSGKDVSKAFGGFAGSGGAGTKEKSIRDVYGKKLGDVYGGIRQSQSKGIQGLKSAIDSWHKAAQSIKGY